MTRNTSVFIKGTITTIMTAAALAAVLVLAIEADGAESWEPVGRQCIAEISARLGGCGSCTAQWQNAVRCILTRTGRSPSGLVVDKCFAQVSATPAPPPGYDRVEAAMVCLRG